MTASIPLLESSWAVRAHIAAKGTGWAAAVYKHDYHMDMGLWVVTHTLAAEVCGQDDVGVAARKARAAEESSRAIGITDSV